MSAKLGKAKANSRFGSFSIIVVTTGSSLSLGVPCSVLACWSVALSWETVILNILDGVSKVLPPFRKNLQPVTIVFADSRCLILPFLSLKGTQRLLAAQDGSRANHQFHLCIDETFSKVPFWSHQGVTKALVLLQWPLFLEMARRFVAEIRVPFDFGFARSCCCGNYSC